MAFASLAAMRALISALLASATLRALRIGRRRWRWRRWWRRYFDLFRRLEKLCLIAVLVDPIGRNRGVLFSRPASGWFVFAGATPPTSATTRGKLAARLSLGHARFRVSVTGFAAACALFTRTRSAALLRSFLARCFLLACRFWLICGFGCRGFRRTFLRGCFARAFAGCGFNLRRNRFFFVVADALKLHTTQCVVTHVVNKTRNVRFSRTPFGTDRFAYVFAAIVNAFELVAAEAAR